MKGQVVKELKQKYNVRRIGGKKVESYNFYTLIHYLEVLENGGEVK